MPTSVAYLAKAGLAKAGLAKAGESLS